MSSYRMKYKIGNTQYHIPVIDDIGGGSGIPLGMILPYSANTLNPPYGFLWCDGSAVLRSMYPELFALIGTLYGSGDGSTTFNLPDLTDSRFLEGTGTAGTEKDAGLPNITVRFPILLTGSSDPSGAISTEVVGNQRAISVGAGWEYSRVNFDASLSSAIYGNSQTVQPKSLTTRYVIKAYDAPSESSAQIDISSYASALNGKPSKSLNDLTAAGEDHFLERDFCYVYPNNGTEENPASVTINSSYIETNPFPGYIVRCVAEYLYNNVWYESPWIGDYINSTYNSIGIFATQVGDNIRVSTGTYTLYRQYSIFQPAMGNGDVFSSTAPCRVKVWKIGKIPT